VLAAVVKRLREAQSPEPHEYQRVQAKLARVDSEFTKLRDAYYAEDNAGCEVRCELVDGVWEALKDNSAG
jgi:hypothetical protein